MRAKKIVNTYAIKIDPSLRNEVIETCTGLRYPDFVAFVVPELIHVKEMEGKIIDVEISFSPSVKELLIER